MLAGEGQFARHVKQVRVEKSTRTREADVVPARFRQPKMFSLFSRNASGNASSNEGEEISATFVHPRKHQ